MNKTINKNEFLNNIKYLIRVRDVKLQEKEILKNRRHQYLSNSSQKIQSIYLKNELENQIQLLEQNIKTIENIISKLCKNFPNSKYVLSIKGISKLSAAIFLAEIEDWTRFSNFEHLLSHLGFHCQSQNTRLCSGQRIVKKQLYLASEQVVRRSEYFKKYYINKLESISKDMDRKEAMFLVSIKLVKVIFDLMKEEREFVEIKI